ncbi:hypothetical protein ABK040_013684 [Willaertia magna]
MCEDHVNVHNRLKSDHETVEINILNRKNYKFTWVNFRDETHDNKCNLIMTPENKDKPEFVIALKITSSSKGPEFKVIDYVNYVNDDAYETILNVWEKVMNRIPESNHLDDLQDINYMTDVQDFSFYEKNLCVMLKHLATNPKFLSYYSLYRKTLMGYNKTQWMRLLRKALKHKLVTFSEMLEICMDLKNIYGVRLYKKRKMNEVDILEID